MPFTFSHPAIVLPGYYLPKRWRSLTGLVAGSVAPDFEMFLRMRALNAFSHTWHSLFWFSLPVALALAFVFHLVVRNPLVDHLPLFLRQRLNRFRRFDWASYFRQRPLLVIFSMLAGAASHIFWDSFTHRQGKFVVWLPVLAQKVTLGVYSLPVYFLLQLSFSVAGGLAVLYAVLRIPPEKAFSQGQASPRYWLVLVAILLLLTVARSGTGVDFSYIPNVIVVLISSGLAGLVVTPFLLSRKKRRS